MNPPGWVPCANCNVGLQLSDEIAMGYFAGVKVACPKCGKPIDWWESLVKAVSADFFLFAVLGPVGALSTHFITTLTPGKTLTIDFSEHGVPSDAKILEINYTCQGHGCHPVELHGNTPIRHVHPHKVSLYAVPRDPPADSTRLAVMVTWVNHTADEEAWRNLVEAFELLAQKRIQSCIIPANVAVESKLTPLVTEFLKRFASGTSVKDFLTDGASYSHQLNVLLPVISRALGLPPLPDGIRGTLNRLRSVRNSIAHVGTIPAGLERKQAAELLVAALLGFHYLTLVKLHLDKAQI